MLPWKVIVLKKDQKLMNLSLNQTVDMIIILTIYLSRGNLFLQLTFLPSATCWRALELTFGYQGSCLPPLTPRGGSEKSNNEVPTRRSRKKYATRQAKGETNT